MLEQVYDHLSLYKYEILVVLHVDEIITLVFYSDEHLDLSHLTPRNGLCSFIGSPYPYTRWGEQNRRFRRNQLILRC